MLRIRPTLMALLLGTTALGITLSGAALANPKGAKVRGGDVRIVERGTGRLDIVQKSDKAIIDWRSFSIDRNEHTHFDQPGRNSVALNRVTGNDRSMIAGQLSADGKIVLLNTNGVVFTDSAKVDVAGLIAAIRARPGARQ